MNCYYLVEIRKPSIILSYQSHPYDMHFDISLQNCTWQDAKTKHRLKRTESNEQGCTAVLHKCSQNTLAAVLEVTL